MPKSRIALIGVCVLCCSRTYGTETLLVHNDTMQVVNVWKLPYLNQQWQGPYRLSPGEAKRITFNSNEWYVIGFRDAYGQASQTKWHNITAVLQQNPNYFLRVTTVTYTVCREVPEQCCCNGAPYVITRPVYETIQRNVIYFVAPSAPCQCR
jgi:hypothetical protein